MKKYHIIFLLFYLLFQFACGVQVNLKDEVEFQAESQKPGLDKIPINENCKPPTSFKQDQIVLEDYFPNLIFNFPIRITQIPNENNYWYVTEKGGKILKVSNDSDVSIYDVFGDVSDRIILSGEGGLLKTLFHPNFQENGRVFLYYSAPLEGIDYNNCGPFTCPNKVILSEFKSNDDGNSIDLNSEKVILSIDRPWNIHYGGGPIFGPDAYLYIAIGDGGIDFSSPPYPQDLNNLNGSILRIDVDNIEPYSIPLNNPFTLPEGLPEIFAFGLRNPWSISIDPETDKIWVADVGFNKFEEINIIEPGANYGWPHYEGPVCINEPCNLEEFKTPISYYNHDDGCAIIGGNVYRGSEIQNLFGAYIFTDLCSGTIWGLFENSEGNFSRQEIGKANFQMSAFSNDQNGEVYVLDHSENGKIFKISPSSTNSIDENIPNLLSDTGCFSYENNELVPNSLVPYNVNVPLWSDNANKLRFFSIPSGKRIQISGNQKWKFPEGSVIIKTFLFDEKPVETRFFVQPKPNEWKGYTYEWDDFGQDASLVPKEGKIKTLSNGQEWLFPSRNQCNRCHTEVAGKVLGIETRQLNRLFHYKETGIEANQIETFKHLDILEGEIEFETGADLPTFPTFFAQQLSNIDDLARSYLHVNCSMCHQPGGPGIGPEDFRYDTILNDIGACDVLPSISNLGITDGKLLSPGNPDKSILFQRMISTSESRMPPLASEIVDNTGSFIIKNWILGLENCN